jgi:hypothetical protein
VVAIRPWSYQMMATARSRTTLPGHMQSNDYHFVTRWLLDGDVDEVADVLGDPLALPRWWPAVYLAVREIEPGAPGSGIGRVIELETKGWLPYRLKWRFRVARSEPPRTWMLEASGDFSGRGIWTLSQEGPRVAAIYDWKVRAQKPLLRWFSGVLRPLFAANHAWAMRTGERSLALELRRRRARTEEERRHVPAPPPPTFARG